MAFRRKYRLNPVQRAPQCNLPVYRIDRIESFNTYISTLILFLLLFLNGISLSHKTQSCPDALPKPIP